MKSQNLHLKSRYKAFTLVEIMVTLAVLSVLTAGVLSATLQISRHIDKSRNLIKAKGDLAVFYQTIYSFANKSFGAYFFDDTNDVELNYLSTYEALNTASADKTIYDTLYFVKNDTGTLIARLVYNETNQTLCWFSGTGAAEQVLLEDVYRSDYDGTDVNINGNVRPSGTNPLFKFPHRSDLYASNTRPNFVILEFRKLIQPKDSSNPQPITVPIKIMAQLNSIN